MRLLSISASSKFLCSISIEKRLTPKTWKHGYNIIRNCKVQQNNMLPTAVKSTHLLNSYLVWEINHRCLHSEPKSIFILAGGKNVTPPTFFDYILAPLIYPHIIRKRLDRNFRVLDFLEGGGQAMHYISKNIIIGNVSALNEVTTPECFHTLTANIKNLSDEHKSLLSCNAYSVLLESMGSITFEYPNNGSDNQPTALRIIFTQICFTSGFEHVYSRYFKVRCSFAEFERTYGTEGKSPWLLSGIKIYSCRI